MEKRLELTREFFAELINALAEKKKIDASTQVCLKKLSLAIPHAVGGGDSLGSIVDKFHVNHGSCCDACKTHRTPSVSKSSAAKKKK
jgi:hypothetical protein